MPVSKKSANFVIGWVLGSVFSVAIVGSGMSPIWAIAGAIIGGVLIVAIDALFGVDAE